VSLNVHKLAISSDSNTIMWKDRWLLDTVICLA